MSDRCCCPFLIQNGSRFIHSTAVLRRQLYSLYSLLLLSLSLSRVNSYTLHRVGAWLPKPATRLQQTTYTTTSHYQHGNYYYVRPTSLPVLNLRRTSQLPRPVALRQSQERLAVVLVRQRLGPAFGHGTMPSLRSKAGFLGIVDFRRHSALKRSLPPLFSSLLYLLFWFAWLGNAGAAGGGLNATLRSQPIVCSLPSFFFCL